MNGGKTPAPIKDITERYRPSGRFAMHYVAGKLRHDPVWPALCQLGGAAPFGDVVDAGCGRGQFAAGLLQAGLARSVVGLDFHALHVRQACAAMEDLPFEGRVQDLSSDADLPGADSVLLIDVLYQLDTDAQRRLLSSAVKSARRLLVLRTSDPSAGARSLATRWLEKGFRRVWPHAGARVNARTVGELVGIMERGGLVCTIAPCWSGTPFSNVLVVGRRA